MQEKKNIIRVARQNGTKAQWRVCVGKAHHPTRVSLLKSWRSYVVGAGIPDDVTKEQKVEKKGGRTFRLSSKTR